MNTDNKELLLQHVAKLDEVIKVLKEDLKMRLIFSPFLATT